MPAIIVNCQLSIVNYYRSGFVTAFAVPETTLPAVFTTPPAVFPMALGTAQPPKVRLPANIMTSASRI